MRPASRLLAALGTIRGRLALAFVLMTLATIVVGLISSYWLRRSQDALDDFHKAILILATRSNEVSQQATRLTTAAPLLFTLRSPYLLEAEGAQLLATVDDAIAQWSGSLQDHAADHMRGAALLANLTDIRGALERLIMATTAIAALEDELRLRMHDVVDIDKALARDLAETQAPGRREALLTARLAVSVLVSASHSDSFLSAGEYRRAFVRLMAGEDMADLPFHADLNRLAGAPDGLFRLKSSVFHQKLASHRALRDLRLASRQLNESVTDIVMAIERQVTDKRGTTTAYLIYAQFLVILIGGAAILLAMISATYVSGYVSSNMERIARAMSGLASGDFSHRLPRPQQRSDEISTLLAAFRVFRATAMRLNRTNRQLRQKTDLLETTFQAVRDGIAVTDGEGRVMACNGQWRKLCPTAAPGTTATGGLPIAGSDLEEINCPDGRILERRSNPLPAGGRVWLVADVTERRQMEERLRRAETLETLGQLTGNVAHDFNNILSTMSSLVPLIGKAGRDEAALKRMEEQLADTVELGATLTNRLLAFARKQNLAPEVVELNELVSGMQELLSLSLGERISLVTDLCDESVHVRIDPGQLENALLNLCINSAAAIRERGTVTISTAIHHPGHVDLTVADNGCGMEPRVRERAVEPFFSTRPEGQGSGLGLSIVYGFVRQSGGELAIESAPGHGTQVSMRLQRVDDTQPPLPRPAKGHETALVVEDGAADLARAEAMVRALGYRVITAASHAAATACIESHRLDVIITDLHLDDGLSGWDLLRLAQGRHPAACLMVTSGRADHLARPPADLADRVIPIAKPLEMSALEACLPSLPEAAMQH